MKILIVSNGHGEDLIGSYLVRSLKTANPGCQIYAVPLVGSGEAYDQEGVVPMIRHSPVSSGGFVRSFGALFKDIGAGLLGHLWRSRKAVIKVSRQIDITVCVGDVFCLVMGAFRNRSRVIFLPTAKSSRFKAHSNVERWMIRKFAGKTYPRDVESADDLKRDGIDAVYLGNVMMDHLDPTGDTFDLNLSDPVLGILPGSRDEVYDNLTFVLSLVEELNDRGICHQFVVSVAGSIDVSRLCERVKEIGWMFQVNEDLGQLVKGDRRVRLSRKFTDVLAVSTVFVGLAGTANEQALFLNKPVVAFQGFGPQSTLQRFYEQQKLMQGGLRVIENRQIPDICDCLREIFSSAKVGVSGAGVGEPASDKVIEDMLAHPFLGDSY